MSDLFAEEVGVDDFALPDDADRIALKNAKAAAVEEAPPEPVVEEPVAVEEPAVEETAERPRNPDGTFAAKEPDVEETPAEKLFAGKYKSADELERAYQELQSHAGRQGSEIAELRQAFEARMSQIDERLATPAAPPVQITSDLIEQNPAYAAQLAFEQDNGTAFAIAFEAWREEDPFGAGSWANSKETERQIADLRAENERQLAEVRSQLAPVTKNAQDAEVRAAYDKLYADFPELKSDNPADNLFLKQVVVVGGEYPDVGAALNNDKNPVEQLRALRLASEIARGRSGDTLQATTEQVARATAEEAQRVREESFVASSTTATSGVKPSKAEEIAAEWDAMDKPYNDGWNV